KTSLQRQRISPRTPRALYFSDDVYVGYCQGGDVLEVSAVDPKLGTVFYTVEQAAQKPAFRRQTDACLLCHGSSQTQGVPGLGDRIDRGGYLSPHSDIVALLVLEHQADAHNLITRANFEARQALHMEALLNREMKLPASNRWNSTDVRIRSVGDALVKYLFFC